MYDRKDIKWITKENPPENISPDELLLITTCKIINTEKSIEHSINTYPAMIEYTDNKAIWTVVDGPDSYIIECDKDKAVTKNVTHEFDEEVIDDERTFEHMVEMITAWSYMPSPYGYDKNERQFVLTGFNRKNKSNIILFKSHDISLLTRIMRRLLDITSTDKKEFPFELSNNDKFDWLEIYKENEIGQLNKRIYYTNSNNEIILQ